MNITIKAAAAALALNVVAINCAGAQNTDSVSDLARSLAASIDSSLSKGEKANVTFIGAISHENIVEMDYVTADAAVFANLKATAETQRTAFTSYFCNAERNDQIMKGVVVTIKTVLQDSSEVLEDTIDRSACQQQPEVRPADAGALAAMAQDIAANENKNQEAWAPPFRAAGVVAHDNVVESRILVLDRSIAEELWADQSRALARIAGSTCPAYLAEIKQGIAFRDVFVLQGGEPVLDVMVDRSAC